MIKITQIAWLSVIIMFLTACGVEQNRIPDTDLAITISAPRSLGALHEARKIEADIQREMEIKSARFNTVLDWGQPLWLTPSGKIREAAFHAGARSSTAGITRSLMLRTPNSLRAVALTSGLREGVYVMLWVIFNNPDTCAEPIAEIDSKCGGGDGSDLELEGTSIYWATGAVVKSDGFGLFHARTEIGDQASDPVEHIIKGQGLTNPQSAEVHLAIKYIGLASKDVEVLSRQLTTIPEDSRSASAVAMGQIPGNDYGFRRIAIYSARQ